MSRFLRRAAALLCLLAATAAIPVALIVFVGNPLPHHFTGWGTVWSSLQQARIPNSTIIKALAIVVWLAWARLTLSVLIELVHVATQRPAPTLPGLGNTQRWAATLVTALMLVAGVAPKVGAGPSTSAPPLHLVPAELLGGAPVSTPRQHETLPDTHVVQRGESFWSIAQSALGDGTRWNEIVEINRGREVAPGVLFDGSAARLLPGWSLSLPAVKIAAGHVVEGGGGAHTVQVHVGDTLSKIADDELGTAHEWPRIWEANRGQHFGSRTFDDPNLILPGWELVIPDDAPVHPLTPTIEVAAADAASTTTPPTTPPTTPTPTPTTARPATPAATVTPTTSAAAEAEVDQQPAMEPEHTGTVDAALPGGLGAAVLVSCGVLGAVTARRRKQLRRSRVGSRLVQPSAVAIETETVLRSLDAAERVTRLDIALRAAAAELSRAYPGTAILGACVQHDGRIELVLTQPCAAAPSPWEMADGNRWVLHQHTDLSALAEAARRVNQPCPALAHLGTTSSPTDEPLVTTDLFIDLEAVGLLTIDGAEPHASNIVRAIAAGASVSPLAEIAHVITCGLDDAHLGHQSAQSAESLDTALDLAAGALGATAAATSPSTTTFALRSLQLGGEAWEPAIVLAVDDTGDHHLDADLVSLTKHPGRGLAVVIGRTVEGATWTLKQQQTGWQLLPLGIEVVPVGLTTGDLDSVRTLVDESAQVVLSPVSTIHSQPRDRVEDGEQTFRDADWSLLVRLLGPVDVVDANERAVKFERSKALELVVWLTQHRDSATRGGARTALWEMNVRDATFANVVSDARRAMSALVTPPAGSDWLGRTLTEQLPLHEGVVTDADLLARRLAYAEGLPPFEAIHTLVPGLTLVRDMPFTGTSYLWPDAEGLTSRLTMLVTSAATVLAGHYLTLGDTKGVFWATGQGLKALAGHEELIALRMRAHARTGDLSGVRFEWESYERALTADAWSDGEPSPKLVALRRELLSPSLLRV